MPTHMNIRWDEMDQAMAHAESIQALATQYDITDVFADNGFKVLQIAVATGLDLAPGRKGPDALDRMGNEYELKTIDIAKGNSGFTTNHHLTETTITRYAGRRFVFAVYEGITLMEAWLVEASDLSPVFQKWRRALKGTRTHLNNPKIPVDFVREVGKIMYLKDVAPPWANPDDEEASKAANAA